jgi:hypothetical protein
LWWCQQQQEQQQQQQQQGQQQWWWWVRKTLQKKLIFLSKNDVFEALQAHITHTTQQASSGACDRTHPPPQRPAK